MRFVDDSEVELWRSSASGDCLDRCDLDLLARVCSPVIGLNHAEVESHRFECVHRLLDELNAVCEKDNAARLRCALEHIGRSYRLPKRAARRQHYPAIALLE
jgi:hypothetical protein